MPVDSLQHVNIRCADAAKSRDFYVEILGLVDGHRPAFQSVGYWLYLGNVPVIHLVQQTAALAQSGGGAIDHVAFRGVDLEATRARLHARAVTFREAVVPRDATLQLFILDPDGVRIELNFEGVAA